MLAAAGIALGWTLWTSLAISASESKEEEESCRKSECRGWEKVGCLGKPFKTASVIASIPYWGVGGVTAAVWFKKAKSSKPSGETAMVPLANTSSEGVMGRSGGSLARSSSKISGPVGSERPVLTTPLMGDELWFRSAGLSAFKMPAVAADTEGRLLLGRAIGEMGCLLLAARGSAFPAVDSAFSVLIGSARAASLTLLGSLDRDLVGWENIDGASPGDLFPLWGWSTEDTSLKPRPAAAGRSVAAALEGTAIEGWPLVLRAADWVFMGAAGAFKGKALFPEGWLAELRAGTVRSLLLGRSWAMDAKKVACNSTVIKSVSWPLIFTSFRPLSWQSCYVMVRLGLILDKCLTPVSVFTCDV